MLSPRKLGTVAPRTTSVAQDRGLENCPARRPRVRRCYCWENGVDQTFPLHRRGEEALKARLSKQVAPKSTYLDVAARWLTGSTKIRRELLENSSPANGGVESCLDEISVRLPAPLYEARVGIIGTSQGRMSASPGTPRASGRTGGSLAAQCERSVGTVMCRAMCRVTPPNTSSRMREWP